jgi:hypothetical protein
MTRHFHAISPRTSPRAAVRDLQNVTRGIRTARTSGTLTVQGLMGSHMRSDVAEDIIRPIVSGGTSVPRWG